ncbi:hypothetical protein [Ferrimonas lipolytica]|uniref:Uncharacterized protein n=1 Tax=Ferrimonas lipolytica TaxID=2724191 RepID=A0A6H1UC35_9GAMM|nr:hypothetical protein [Ferrimonas lipolytica]QIZ76635.1 hypothetical protein HER31_06990 [Ferrimonas lipolytica]
MKQQINTTYVAKARQNYLDNAVIQTQVEYKASIQQFVAKLAPITVGFMFVRQPELHV